MATTRLTVLEGVVEELPSGKYDAALRTDQGRLVLRGAERSDRLWADSEKGPTIASPASEAIAHLGELAADELLRGLADAGTKAPSRLLCAIEMVRFLPSQREILLPLLWRHILDHRNSNHPDDLVGVAAAIRKYIAMMPMERMGQLAALLESGHRSPVPVDLEIEVAKMIYRNFEVHPPVVADPQPELAHRLWEMARVYIDPRILLRDNYSAVASLAIEAIVAMRSPLAEAAWRAAIASPYRWFAELVTDELDELREKWDRKNLDAAAWLRQLRGSVLAA
jgi:hypothetical protein